MCVSALKMRYRKDAIYDQEKHHSDWYRDALIGIDMRPATEVPLGRELDKGDVTGSHKVYVLGCLRESESERQRARNSGAPVPEGSRRRRLVVDYVPSNVQKTL